MNSFPRGIPLPSSLKLDGSTSSLNYLDEAATRRAIKSILSFYGRLAGSSLGSRGAYKLVYTRHGEVVATGKLYLLLEELPSANPIASLVLEAARSQWRLYGDGVKTVLLAAYRLFSEGVKLIEEHGLRPSQVVEGYEAAQKIHRVVLEELAGMTGPASPAQAARSFSTGSQEPGVLSTLLYEALKRYYFRQCKVGLRDAVAVEGVEGGSVYDSRLVEGVVAEKRIMQYNAPRYARGPMRVAVIDQKLYLDYKGRGLTLVASDPEAVSAINPVSRLEFYRRLSRLVDLGVNVLVNVKGVDPVVEQWLYKAGVLSVRRIDKGKARHLAAASGARITSALDQLDPSDVGVIDALEEVNLGGRYYTVFYSNRSCASTILLRGPWHTVHSMRMEAEMAVRGLEAYLEDPRGLPGGGAAETEASLKIRERALLERGKTGMAMEAYAEAIEVIPRSLARHTGLDPIEAMAELRRLHSSGNWAAGIDEDSMEISSNVVEKGIVDSYRVRASAVFKGASLAVALLRVTGVYLDKRGMTLRVTRERGGIDS